MRGITIKFFVKSDRQEYAVLGLPCLERDDFLAVVQIIKKLGGFFVLETKDWLLPANLFDVLEKHCEPLYERLQQDRCHSQHLVKQIHQQRDQERNDLGSQEWYSKEFHKNSTKVVQRDQGQCQLCGSRGGITHHIHPLRFGGSNKLSNLVMLCESCHGLTHAFYTETATNIALKSDKNFFKQCFKNIKSKVHNAQSKQKSNRRSSGSGMESGR